MANYSNSTIIFVVRSLLRTYLTGSVDCTIISPSCTFSLSLSHLVFSLSVCVVVVHSVWWKVGCNLLLRLRLRLLLMLHVASKPKNTLARARGFSEKLSHLSLSLFLTESTSRCTTMMMMTAAADWNACISLSLSLSVIFVLTKHSSQFLHL